MWRFRSASWLLLSLMTAATASAEGDATVLRVAAPAYWCPLSCEAGRGHDGFSVDIARAALAREGVALEYQNLPYGRALAEVRKGKVVDAVLPAMKDEAADFVFASEPAAVLKYCFYVERDNPWTFEGVRSLGDVSLVASAGYRYGAEIDAYIARERGVRVSLLTGELLPNRMIRMVLSERADAMLDDVTLVGFALRSGPFRDSLRQAGCVSETFPAFLAISPGRGDAEALARKFDRGVRALRESGELQRILDRYRVQGWD